MVTNLPSGPLERVPEMVAGGCRGLGAATCSPTGLPYDNLPGRFNGKHSTERGALGW